MRVGSTPDYCNHFLNQSRGSAACEASSVIRYKVQPSIKTKVISAQYSTERDSSLNVFLIVCNSETRFVVDQQMPLLHVSAGEVTNC